jgi:hypothetical protein
MAFDVYVGTFTRFYTRSWENTVQRQAKLDGVEYRMIYAGGDTAPPTAGEVLEVINSWRDGMNSGLAPHGLGPILWSEDEAQPYLTDRPGWPGYSGLLLWAAYAQTPHLHPPYALPESWADDPAYQESMKDENLTRYAALLRSSLWLPGDFRFGFKFPGLTEGEVMIGCTQSLLDDLTELASNQPQWAVPQIGADIIPLEEAAKEGMRIFRQLAASAVQHKLPLILSF